MDHARNLISLLKQTARRHDLWQVFRDFVSLSAISISNAVDWRERDAREAAYMETVHRYERAELECFPRMLGELTLALEAEACDVLGKVLCELELANKWTGQFFTPDSVCRMMAAITVDNHVKHIITERGYVLASEPAVGGGAMVIALCRELLAQGINYQQHLHVTAIDIDIRAVHMAYVQLSLLHVPAVVVHGDSLQLTESSRWFTPAHVLGGWNWKLSKHDDVVAPPLVPSDDPEESKAQPRQLSLF